MFLCGTCGAKTPRWQGRCARCGAWGALAPDPDAAGRGARGRSGAGRRAGPGPGPDPPEPTPLASVSEQGEPRLATGLEEFDRVLGGGLVAGSVTLVGGEPGIGKSTLLLDLAARVARARPGGAPVLYVAGEEAPAQVALRARRIGARADALALLDTTDTDEIAEALARHRPRLAVVDSVQTVRSRTSTGAPGGPAQVRAAADLLVPAARETGCALVLVGQVTKVGGLAGPRTLEHAVDTVILFEGDRHTSLRALRAVKNRHGPTDEIGLFEMREDGLTSVRNASDRLLADRRGAEPGAVVATVVEGRRPLCLEVQALLSGSRGGAPRRRARGLDPRRAEVLVGVVEALLDATVAERDVYVSVVGGLTVRDTGLDLAVAVALLGANRGLPVAAESVVIGEVGLRGEVRAVPQTGVRLKEARAMGFARAFVPPGTPPLPGILTVPVARVDEVLLREDPLRAEWRPAAERAPRRLAAAPEVPP